MQSLHDGLKDVGGHLEGQLEDDFGGDGDGEEVKGLREENERLKAAAAEAEGSSEGLREEVRERRGGVFLFRFLFCLISILLTLLFSLPLPHFSFLKQNEKLKAMSLANVALSEESLKKANAEIESLKADLLARADGNADSDALREENESLKAMVKAKVEENERLKEVRHGAATVGSDATSVTSVRTELTLTPTFYSHYPRCRARSQRRTS